MSLSSSSQSKVKEKSKKKLKTYSNRKLNLMKKASELSTLCQTDTFVIGYGPQGDDVFTWPENPTQLHTLIQRYKRTDAKDRMKHSTNLSDIIHQNVTRKTRKAETDMNQQTHQNDDDNSKFLLVPAASGDDYGFTKRLTTLESLREFNDLLDSKLQKLEEKKLEYLCYKEKKKQKKIDDGELLGVVRASHTNYNQTHLVSSSETEYGGGGGDPSSWFIRSRIPWAPSFSYAAGSPIIYGNASYGCCATTDCGDLSLIVHGSTPQVSSFASSSWDGRNSLVSTPNYPGCEQYYNHQTQPSTTRLSELVAQDDESRHTTSTSPIDYDDLIDFSFLFSSEETQSVEEEEAS